MKIFYYIIYAITFAIFFQLISLNVYSKNKKLIEEREIKHKIKGIVISQESGHPINDVFINVYGTRRMAKTDANGNFTLIDDFPAIDSTSNVLFTEIVISHISYVTQSCTIGSSINTDIDSTYTFKLKTQIINLSTHNSPVSESTKNYRGIIQKIIPAPPTNRLYYPEQEEETYFTEQFSEYPGGITELKKYVLRMQKELALSHKIKGKAKVNFTINKNGKVTDIKIVEKDNDGAAKGAYIIAEGMEDWKPGKQRGKPVSVKFLLPVEFK